MFLLFNRSLVFLHFLWHGALVQLIFWLWNFEAFGDYSSWNSICLKDTRRAQKNKKRSKWDISGRWKRFFDCPICMVEFTPSKIVWHWKSSQEKFWVRIWKVKSHKKLSYITAIWRNFTFFNLKNLALVFYIIFLLIC